MTVDGQFVARRLYGTVGCTVFAVQHGDRSVDGRLGMSVSVLVVGCCCRSAAGRRYVPMSIGGCASCADGWYVGRRQDRSGCQLGYGQVRLGSV